jgi:predicted GNAT family acetyltransferase
VPVGTACMRRIGPDTAEIKRTYVQPSQRRAGVGRAMLDRLIAAARTAGYQRIRPDSPDFMTAAHGLYRSSGFVETEPNPESEIPRPLQVTPAVHGATTDARRKPPRSPRATGRRREPRPAGARKLPPGGR